MPNLTSADPLSHSNSSPVQSGYRRSHSSSTNSAWWRHCEASGTVRGKLGSPQSSSSTSRRSKQVSKTWPSILSILLLQVPSLWSRFRWLKDLSLWASRWWRHSQHRGLLSRWFFVRTECSWFRAIRSRIEASCSWLLRSLHLLWGRI